MFRMEKYYKLNSNCMSYSNSNKNLATVGELVNAIIDKYRLRSRYDEVKVVHAWENVMPPTILNRTTKVSFRDGILHVKVTSAPLREELNSMGVQVVEKLNEELGQIIIRSIKVA